MATGFRGGRGMVVRVTTVAFEGIEARTVDVHIRRLRSKLGPEFEAIIGTVRNVGYRFTLPNGGKESPITERV